MEHVTLVIEHVTNMPVYLRTAQSLHWPWQSMLSATESKPIEVTFFFFRWIMLNDRSTSRKVTSALSWLPAQLASSLWRDKGAMEVADAALGLMRHRVYLKESGLEPFVFSCAWPPEADSVQGCTGQQMWVWYRAAMDNPFLKCLGGHIYGSRVREAGCMSNNQHCGRLTLCWEAFLFCEVSFLPWYPQLCYQNTRENNSGRCIYIFYLLYFIFCIFIHMHQYSKDSAPWMLKLTWRWTWF